MGRKNQKVSFESINADVASQIVLATSGQIKDKKVDPCKQIGTIHIKKYIAFEKINKKYESWISLIRKSMLAEQNGTVYDYSAEEQALFDDCKTTTQAYLEEEGSEALKKKILEQTNQLENLKNIASSMKFKFSTYSFEVITYMVNLIVREILVYTCDNCLSKGSKLTKESHIPWDQLQDKMLSGLYMNTPLVYGVVHKTTEEAVVEEVAVEETTEEVAVEEAVVEETTEEGAVEETAEEETTEGDKPKKFRPRLTQYITNIFKEIRSREPRFQKLLLGKGLIKLINNLVYQVMDRYVNVIKSLLMVSNSKTITDHLATISTVILLKDDIHTSDDDVNVIIDLLQSRLEILKQHKPKKDSEEDVESVVEEEPVEESAVEEPVVEAPVVEEPVVEVPVVEEPVVSKPKKQSKKKA